MDVIELVEVFTLRDAVYAEIIKNGLESEGIEVFLDGEGQGGMTSLLDIRIMVKDRDEKRAREILLEHDHR